MDPHAPNMQTAPQILIDRIKSIVAVLILSAFYIFLPVGLVLVIIFAEFWHTLLHIVQGPPRTEESLFFAKYITYKYWHIV